MNDKQLEKWAEGFDDMCAGYGVDSIELLKYAQEVNKEEEDDGIVDLLKEQRRKRNLATILITSGLYGGVGTLLGALSGRPLKGAGVGTLAGLGLAGVNIGANRYLRGSPEYEAKLVRKRIVNI